MEARYFSCAQTRIQQYVEAMWQTAGTPGYGQESILPKGIIELIFSFADPLQVSLGAAAGPQTTPQCFVSGMTTQPLHLLAPAYQCLFGVQLTPLAVKKLLKVPAGEFLNTITDLQLLPKTVAELASRLAEAASFEQRVGLVEHWAGQQLTALAPQDLLISSYLHRARPGAGSVTALAAQACYSPRQLSRKARDFFGLPTEGLLRYKRYVLALQALHQPAGSLTEIGLACGYYDQAHFIREFRQYTGLTPGEYRRQRSPRPGHVFH
jgi:AraC-like DNA-binding protein